MNTEAFSERLSRIQGRMGAAARRAGRSLEEITLVAVTKKQPLPFIAIAHELGLRDFGENYVQEGAEKRDDAALPDCCWHLIGHLQSNKAKAAVETFDLIQSIDSIRLARQVAKHAEVQGKTQRILLQVHLGDEGSKTGFPPEDAVNAVQEVAGIPGLMLEGLMGIAPQNADARPYFRLLRRLFERLPASAQTVLSMGMTNDFEAAIEEGATMVRIGTALFGARTDAGVMETLDQ